MKLDIEKTHQNLTERVKQYIYLIIDEYGQYMPGYNLERLQSISDFRNIIKIYDYGEINAYANQSHINMPLCVNKLLENLKIVPGYGINKNHQVYDDDTIILNDNTYFTYVKHFFVSGSDTQGYYEDLLLHETMHFCGSGGNSIIKEGITELLTRMIAKKYNLRTSSCGYPKEVKLVYKLMECLGEDTIISLAFINNYYEQLNYLSDKLGEDAAIMYDQVVKTSEKEFYEKYYSHMNEFKGGIGIIKKILKYRELDYSEVHSIIDNYRNKKDDVVKGGITK